MERQRPTKICHHRGLMESGAKSMGVYGYGLDQ
jgi:hypothetical protein